VLLIGTREFAAVVRVEVNQIDFARDRFGDFYDSIGVFERIVDVREHDVLEEDSLLSSRSFRALVATTTTTITTTTTTIIAKSFPDHP
jgi:hypothetical protein|tara:strand:+ start:470 stop:733 length:264 start_codon:yes stop_codon:yes gene_type:complete